MDGSFPTQSVNVWIQPGANAAPPTNVGISSDVPNLTSTFTSISTPVNLPTTGSVNIVQSPPLVAGGTYLVIVNLLVWNNLGNNPNLTTFWIAEQPANTVIGGSQGAYNSIAIQISSGSYSAIAPSTGGQMALMAVATQTGYQAFPSFAPVTKSTSILTVRIA